MAGRHRAASTRRRPVVRAAPTGLVPSGGRHQPCSRPGSGRGGRGAERRRRVAAVGRRYDTVSFLSDYGTADEFVGVVKSVIRDLARHVTVIDLTHEIAPVRRARRVARARPRPSSTCRRASCSPSSTPASAPTAGRSPSRSPTAKACSSAPTTGCSRRPSAMAGGAGRAVELTNARLPPARAGRHVRRPRRLRSGRRPTSATASTWPSSASAVDPGSLLPRHRPAAAGGRRRARRRGAVGRPLRQRAAQRRPRTTSTAGAIGVRRAPRRRRSRAAVRLDDVRRPRRRPSAWSSTPTACWRCASTGARRPTSWPRRRRRGARCRRLDDDSPPTAA